MAQQFQAFVLGTVQGLTEFLPVSSSAHLVLVPWLLSWRDQGLAFDVALHIGTLMALLIYYWRYWLAMGASLVNGDRPEAATVVAARDCVNSGGDYRTYI